jgi:hypothetical protein
MTRPMCSMTVYCASGHMVVTFLTCTRLQRALRVILDGLHKEVDIIRGDLGSLKWQHGARGLSVVLVSPYFHRKSPSYGLAT